MVQIAPLPLVRGANNMKRWIYVVDDQVPVMETAVLIMRSIDPQWEVSGFKDPLTALAAVRAKAPDLILSDQLMPEMLGSQLLENVREISPTTIRIIMSGFVALNKRALPTSAHQYIAKPFDTIKLRETIRRSFAAQERVVDKSLQASPPRCVRFLRCPRPITRSCGSWRTTAMACQRSRAWWPKMPGCPLKCCNWPILLCSVKAI